MRVYLSSMRNIFWLESTQVPLIEKELPSILMAVCMPFWNQSPVNLLGNWQPDSEKKAKIALMYIVIVIQNLHKNIKTLK